MLQQQTSYVISLKALLGDVVALNTPQEIHSELRSAPTLINEVNSENLKALKDGGTAFVLSLCLFVVVITNFIKELRQD